MKAQNRWLTTIPVGDTLSCVRVRTLPGLCPGKYRNGQMVDTARWFSECVSWLRLEPSERCSDWLLIGRVK